MADVKLYTLRAILILILQFISMLPVLGQTLGTVKVRVNAHNIRFEDALEILENKTGFEFHYNTSPAILDKRVDISSKGQSLRQILKSLAKQTHVDFRRIEKHIFVQKSQAPQFIYKAHSQVNTKPIKKVSKEIHGVIKDGSGNPLMGATVQIKHVFLGTLTDSEGNFSIQVPQEYKTLVISYIGYQSKEIYIGNQAYFEVQLQDDVETLNELLVIGYGTQYKSDLTTSIASIDAKELKDQAVNSFDQTLMGKLAGVQVIQSSGSPGAGVSIRIRGIGSITAGNDPLYVIDGMPVSNDNNRATGEIDVGRGHYPEQPVNVLSSLNPTDIQSIQVLKDASAAAIYGSRGSNGVILINTKRGRIGKPKINYNAYYGIQETTTRYDMTNAYEWAELAFEGRNNSYKDRFPTGNDNDSNEQRLANLPGVPGAYMPEIIKPYLFDNQGLTDTDWQDEIFRRASIQSHTLSISGGTDKIMYYASAEYMNQQGLVISTGFERYSARVNLEVNHKKLKFGININPAYTKNDMANTEGPWWDHGVIGTALHISPIWPVYNPDGSYNFDANSYTETLPDGRSVSFALTDAVNPVALANEIQDFLSQFRILGNVYVQYEFLKNISYKLSIGYDLNRFERNYFWPSYIEERGRKGPRSPLAMARNRNSNNWLVENILSYQFTKEKHDIQAIAGFTAQQEEFSSMEITASGYSNNQITTLNAGQITGGSSSKEKWSLQSFLARIQYSFKDKFYFSAAIRADGSSRFARNNKWGYFPSLSVGYNISEEMFMQAIPILSYLKLRVSYGLTGNFQIGNYSSVGLLGYSDYIFGGSTVAPGIAPATPSNDDLSWERTAMIDFGLDIGLFEDKIFIEFDYYHADTKDLLLNVPTSPTSGFTSALKNIGQVNNKGIEIALLIQDQIGDFSWAIRCNFSKNKNKVISLSGNQTDEIIAGGGTESAQWITKPGEAIGSYYNPVYDGVFMNQTEIETYPSVGNARPGDLKFLDLDGDGVINFANDRAIQGNYMPDFTYGAVISMMFKGVDFSLSLQGVQGNEILHLFRRYVYNQEGNMNLMRGALNRWISEDQPGNGQTNRTNRLQTGSNGQTSNWHLEDGSYMRIRNITLGYSFSKEVLQRIYLSELRLYLAVQNPFTFTKYLGYNPEVSSRPDNALNPGEDYASYPLARTYTLGVNLSF